LRAQDKRALEALLRGGVQQVRVVVRAMVRIPEHPDHRFRPIVIVDSGDSDQ